MFNLIVSASLRQRLFVLLAALGLIIYGSSILPRVPVDVFPDLTRPIVTVMTEAEGLAPQEVETLISAPIEQSMSGIPNVGRVRSVSGVGLSLVYVEFDWGTNVQQNRQYVAERISRVRERLPRGMQPSMGGINQIMGEIMLLAVSAEGKSPMELREIAEFTVRPRLLAVPGVAQVIPIGGEVRQLRVAPDLAAMRDLGVTPDQIEGALKRLGLNTGGGFVDQHGNEFLVRNIGDGVDLEAIRDLPVAMRDGRTILMRQVADVGYGIRNKRGEAGYNGAPAVILSIQKTLEADTLPTTRLIEAELAAIQKAVPKGVKADQVQFRQATFIETSINNVKSVLVEAAIVVAIVLALFLMNWRATVISLTAIPISILITVVVFQMFGLTINTMTLGGLAIAIGELVDDAVVGVENILRRMRENKELAEPKPALQVIAHASQEVRSGIFYATIIIALVFVPLFALTGLEGRLFTPLGIAYIVSIFGSLIASITVTPVLAYYLLSGKSFEHKDSFVVRWLKAGYERLLAWGFERSGALMSLVALSVVAAALAAFQLPRSFLPPFNEGTLLVGMQYNPGISLAESNRLGLVAERIVMSVPEVHSVGRRTGRAEMDSHAEGVHASELDIDLKRSQRPKEEVFAEIRDKLAVLPVQVALGQPISHRIDHMLSGVRAALAIKVFGDDLDALRTIAEDMRKRLTGVNGLVDINVEKVTLVPQVRVQVSQQKASQYGMTAAQVTEAIEALSNGRVLGQIVESGRRFDLVIRLKEDERTTDGLKSTLIQTPAGYVPLSYLAEVEETVGPNQVLRENGQRRIILFANGDGVRDMAAIVADIKRITGDMPLPQGYVIRVDGTFQAQEQATRMIGLLSLVSLALIFMVLYSRYGSVVLSGIILLAIPLGLIGSVVALMLAGQPLSIASMIGFVTLAGITARNGILKISHYINLALNEGEVFGRKLVVRGSLERLTPVLMTALAAGLALVPLMIGSDLPGREILHPVAVTIFGGLVSATLIDTLLTPILFLKFGKAPLERIIAQRTAMLDETPLGAAARAEAY
jgi:HME family heavy-metal exporter